MARDQSGGRGGQGGRGRPPRRSGQREQPARRDEQPRRGGRPEASEEVEEPKRRPRSGSPPRGAGAAKPRSVGSDRPRANAKGKPRDDRGETGRTREAPKRPAGKRQKPAAPAAPAPQAAPLRLQAFLARAGVASRRASEELISAGRVTVNGRTVTEQGTRVHPDADRVYVDGKRVEQASPVWIMLNKPKGYVTTRDDPSDRRTVYDLLPPELHALFHVGRLDRNSEGLLLLTNEGRVAHRLLHPSYGITKEYVVLVEGLPDRAAMQRLVRGVEVDGETLTAELVEIIEVVDNDHTRLRLVLREGRNREVRRMLEQLGFPVRRLVRKQFGPIALGKLRRGEWRHLTLAELEALRTSGREEDLPED